MQAIYRTREAPLGSYTERETQITLDPQELLEFKALLHDLLHENRPQYQDELVQNLFIRLTPEVLEAQSTKGFQQ